MNTRTKNSGRIKKPVLDPSAINIESVVGEIAALKNAERSLCADMDAERQQLEARYARPNPLLSDPHTALGLVEIRKRLETEAERAQLWAEAHPEKFAKRKSLELTHGKLGFRTGTPKLKTLPKWTWGKVLDYLRGMRWSYRFTRIVEEIDKEAILASKLDAATLAQVGVKVVQDETFFVEPNLTALETRETAQSPAKAA